MIAFVDAKREEFLEELDAIDVRDLMDSEVTKWNVSRIKSWPPVFLRIFVMIWHVRVSDTLSYLITAALRITMLDVIYVLCRWLGQYISHV